MSLPTSMTAIFDVFQSYAAFAVAVVLVSRRQSFDAFVKHRMELFPVSVAIWEVPADACKTDSVTTKCKDWVKQHHEDVASLSTPRGSAKVPRGDRTDPAP